MTKSSGNILVVDDNTNMRKTLQVIFEHEGYHVDTAPDGMTALDLVSKSHYHVVFLDIKMTPMDGIEVLKNIRQIDQELPVVMVTAYAMPSLIEQAMQYNAFRIFRKPLDIPEILDLIERIVSKNGVAQSS